jgi:hypothetical protein
MAERLTDRGIAALKPSANSVYHFDTEVSGLAVRVYPSRVSFSIGDITATNAASPSDSTQHGPSARRGPMPHDYG